MSSSRTDKRYITTGCFLVLMLAGSVFAGRFFFASSPPSAYAGDVRAKGPENAPVEIVEYSDFQCPACAKSQEVLHGFWTRYPGKIRMVYRHFPLSGHQWAAAAHQAAECSAQQGKFWEYHDVLFQEQAIWSGPFSPSEKFLQYGKNLGLDLDSFAACLADETVREKIMAEKKAGLDLQVRSTPTFFVNQQRLVGHIDLASRGEKIIRDTLGLDPVKAEETENAPQA